MSATAALHYHVRSSDHFRGHFRFTLHALEKPGALPRPLAKARLALFRQRRSVVVHHQEHGTEEWQDGAAPSRSEFWSGDHERHSRRRHARRQWSTRTRLLYRRRRQSVSIELVFGAIGTPEFSSSLVEVWKDGVEVPAGFEQRREPQRRAFRSYRIGKRFDELVSGAHDGPRFRERPAVSQRQPARRRFVAG